MQDILNQILSWVSLFVGISALVLSGYTIWLARVTERETREKFQRAEDRMHEHYERLKDVLSAIEVKGATTEQTVRISQEHLISTITNLINEIVIPKKQDMGDQISLLFAQSFLNDPAGAEKRIQFMPEFTKLINMMKGGQK